MKPTLSKPPSRIGKKQLAAYLDVEMAERVHAYAEREGKTIQEVMAEAVNAVFLAHGKSPVLLDGHVRVFRRRKSTSKARQSTTAKSRRGKRSVVGWFDEKSVEKVHRFSNEVNLSILNMFKTGFLHLTGVQILDIDED